MDSKTAEMAITLFFSTFLLLSCTTLLSCGHLYETKGWFKDFYHDTLHWHQPDNSPKWSDGCSMHCKCKWCGKEIMQDSQGGWFLR